MEVRSTLRAALAGREVQLVEQAADADRPDLGRLLDLPLGQLSAEDLNDLRSAVGVLLCMHGFDRNWEPNAFGWECEDLSRLAPWHWGKDN